MQRTATESAKSDATCLIGEANFSRNFGGHSSNSKTSWTGTKAYGGDNTNIVCEQYHNSSTNVYQTLTVPNGTYTLHCQGFYRADGSKDAAYLYANDDKSALMQRSDEPEAGDPNTMAAVSTAFTNGYYTNNSVTTTVTDNTLTIGIKCTDGNNWVIFDNFSLEYYGWVNPTSVTVSAKSTDVWKKQDVTITTTTDPKVVALPEVTLTSSDTKIATVKDSKTINIVGTGEFTITATVDSVSSTAYTMTAKEPDYTDLVEAINDAEENTLGFEKGEYAPYNNTTAISTLNTAKAMYDGKTAITQDNVDSVKTALTGATWTANTTLVNAVYNGDFALCENDGTMAGWISSNNTLGGSLHSRAFVLTSGMNNYDNLAAFNQGDGTRSAAYIRFDGTNSTTGTWYDYGKTVGYTMPLKENVTYCLSFDAGAWGDYANKLLSVNIFSEKEEGRETFAATLKTTKKTSSGQGVDHFEYTFTPTKTENYVIGLWNANGSNYAAIFSNVKLYPAYTRTVNTANLGTLCVPYAFEKPSTMTLYTVGYKNTENKYIHFDEFNDTPVAGTPYLFTSTQENITLIYSGAPATDPETVNGLVGTFESVAITANDGNYVLSNNQLYVVDGEFSCGANRAYIHLADVPEGSTGAKGFTLGFDDATGINNVDATSTGSATDTIYNLAGQRVNKLQKGISIVNGKKVLY